jgi:hypothetical protein
MRMHKATSPLSDIEHQSGLPQIGQGFDRETRFI